MKEIPFNDFVAKYHAGEIQVPMSVEQEEYTPSIWTEWLCFLSVLAERYAELDKDPPIMSSASLVGAQPVPVNLKKRAKW